MKSQELNLVLKRTPCFLVDFSSNYTKLESRMKEHKHMNPEDTYYPCKQVRKGEKKGGKVKKTIGRK